MGLEAAFKEKLQDHLKALAIEMKNTIEYEFSVEYGRIDLGEPTVTENSISFDLSNLSSYEKHLLEEYYYDNAKKRKAKGGG